MIELVVVIMLMVGGGGGCGGGNRDERGRVSACVFFPITMIKCSEVVVLA